MNEVDRALNSFLADLGSPVAQLGYADWLEQWKDGRGQYFRLLTGLEKSTDGTAEGKIRQLAELLKREKIDPVWARWMDRMLIATGGVYQCDLPDGSWHYLRFYADSSVRSVCCTQTALEAWQRVDESKNHDHTVGRGVYEIRFGELKFHQLHEPSAALHKAWRELYDQQINKDIAHDFDFVAADAAIREHQSRLAEDMKRVNYSGAADFGTLLLRWYRPLDRSAGRLNYRFVDVKSS